jgi:hypothetical protein
MESAMIDKAAWFAVRTSARDEKQVHARLGGRGIESFLPRSGAAR